MHRQLRARSIAELRDVQRIQEMWPTNLVAADSHGNIYYLRTGRVPVRKAGLDWTRPLDGNTSATAWGGIHPLDDLVQIENPASGYLHNNNESPDMMYTGSPLTPDHYAPEVYGERPSTTNFRGRRAELLLSGIVFGTVGDMMSILFDEKWEGSDALTAGLRGAVARQAATVATDSAPLRRFTDRVARFDGVADRASVAALSYLYWRRALSENELANRVLARLALQDSVPGAAYDTVLMLALPRAMQLLRQDFGTTERAFGEVFRTGRGGTSLPMGGFIGTMRAMVYGPPDSLGVHHVRAGQRQPLVVELGHPVVSFTALNFGESNDPPSPHYSDQARLMSEKRLKPTYFEPSTLRGHITQRRTLVTRP